MSQALPIRKHILQTLERIIIPALQSGKLPHVLAIPPYASTRFEHWTLRAELLPDRTPDPMQTVWVWRNECMVASRTPYIGFVYEGKADERFGVTAAMATSLPPGKYSVSGITAVRLKAPAVICFPPEVPHRDGSGPFREERPGASVSSMLWIHVSHQELLIHYCESSETKLASSHSLQVKEGTLVQLAKAYVDELHHAQREGDESAHALLLVLMKRLRRHLEEHVVPLSNTEWPGHDLIRFSQSKSRGELLCQQAIEYIVRHLQDAITRETLAAELECSPPYLNRLFQKFTGMPVMRYVTLRRIEAAKLLLAQEEHRISEIAQLTGFANSDSFSACFKRHEGCGPREFRKIIHG